MNDKARPKRVEIGTRAPKPATRAARKRPEGELVRARVALTVGAESRIKAAWTRFDEALKTFRRPSTAKLAPGATEVAIKRFATTTGLQLPDDVRGYWSVHNGETSEAFGLAAGFHFLSLAQAAKSLAAWAETRRTIGKAIQPFDRRSRSHPPNAIQKKYSLPGWLPLLSDREGNHVGIDLDPGPAGRVGQVINFGRDEEDKYVLFPGIVELIEWLAVEYEAKHVLFDKTDNVIRHVDGRVTGVVIDRMP